MRKVLSKYPLRIRSCWTGLLLAAALSLLLAACGGGTTTTSASTATTAPTATPTPVPAASVLNGATIVQIVEQGEGNYRFVPASLTVKAGTVVVWVNGTDTMHTVISKTGAPGPFSTTGMLAPAQTFAVLFSAPGTYPYQCSIHPTTMQATITVTS